MRWLVALMMIAACGDERQATPIVEQTSGARLALGSFRFDDGADLAAPSEIYDKLAHVRCAPGRWLDDQVRCVPLADEAFYVDATCETFVGRADTEGHPTAFVGYEEKAGERRPAHVLRAGAATTAPAGIYRKRDGMCIGPEFTDPSVTYFSVPGEYDDAVAFGVAESADDVLAIELNTASDGARWITGFGDVALDQPCSIDARHRCGMIALDADVEDTGRRIERVVLSDGAQRFYDARVHDTLLGIDCVPQLVVDTWRCMPEVVAGTATYRAAGCIDPLVVAVVATAVPAAFVSVSGPDGSERHVVGSPITAYVGTPFSCGPAVPAPGTELRAIGAKVPDDAFDAAILFTAR